jgi:hypothetical protein
MLRGLHEGASKVEGCLAMVLQPSRDSGSDQVSLSGPLSVDEGELNVFTGGFVVSLTKGRLGELGVTLGQVEAGETDGRLSLSHLNVAPKGSRGGLEVAMVEGGEATLVVLFRI